MKKHGEKGLGAYLNGLAGEDMAERLYLQQAGRILQRRARTAAGEIDLIVSIGGLTVFVEVKARRSLAQAAHSLSRGQMDRIGLAAQCWLAENGMSEEAIRFDVVLIDRQGGAEILENAISFDA